MFQYIISCENKTKIKLPNDRENVKLKVKYVSQIYIYKCQL